jgi:hypothetical protein
MAMTPKQVAARLTLNRILDSHERQLRDGAETKQHPLCVVRGDAICFGCESVDLEALRAHPDFHRTSDRLVRRRRPDAFLAYRRISRFKCTRTGSGFCVYYQRLASNLPQFRIEFFPDDQLGLQRPEITSVLQHTTKSRIARMETSFDFGLGSGVNNDFVRRSVISGKSQAHSVREQIFGDQWGSRGGSKFLRSYFKKVIGAHRVELQLNGRFLRRHGIDDIFQFYRLVKLIPVHHLYFGRIDHQKLIARLKANGISAEDIVGTQDAVRAREKHLWAALNYLRRRVGLTNVRRLLTPLSLNKVAREALKKWARKWPKTPARLGTKP